MSWKRKVYFKFECGKYWLLNVISSRYYRKLSETQLRESRRSDTVFIFGSGYSLNDITAEEWQRIEKHDTVGFNWFVYQNFVRVDFHLFRELSPDDLDKKVWLPKILQYAGLIRDNRHYRDSVFLVQGEYRALNGNQLVAMRLLPAKAKIFRFKTKSRGIYEPPGRTFNEGIVHGPSSLFNCINFAYIMGWRNIVLAGVDLCDRRYFWLKPDETRDSDRMRGASCKDMHNTAERTINFIAKWKDIFAWNGMKLYVYNPRSLLADVLPVFRFAGENGMKTINTYSKTHNSSQYRYD